MRSLQGLRGPETRRDRARLSVRDPMVESLVGHLDFDENILEDVRAWCKQVCRDRNRWSIRRCGLLAEGRRLARADADRALRLELAALAEGGEA